MSSAEFSRFIQTVGAKPLLTATQEKELGRRIQAGDPQAKQTLVEHNVKLVIHNAKRFSRMGFDLEDLVQAGCVGLMRAAAKFDPEKNRKFSTYATWWITKELQEYMNGGGNMNIMKVPHDVPKMQRTVKEALEAGMSQDQAIEAAAEAHKKTPAQVKEILHIRRDMGSLDRAAMEDGDTWHEKIADPNADDPTAILEDVPELKAALDALPEQQRKIVELRFGFFGKPVHTRQDIADALGTKPAVVKREQARAIAALRRKVVSDRLGIDPDDEPARLRIAFEQLEAGMLPAGEEACETRPV